MSRRDTKGYNHRINYVGWGCYRLSWVFDAHYSDSRLRFPRTIRRDSDLEGAKRFSKKWGCKLPDPAKTAAK